MPLDHSSRFIAAAFSVGAITFACSSEEGSGGADQGNTNTSVTNTATSTASSATSTGGTTGTSATLTSTTGTTGTSTNTVTSTSSSTGTSNSTGTATSSGNGTTDATSSTSAGGTSSTGGAGGTTSTGAGGTMGGGDFTFTTPAFDDMEGCTCEAKESCDTFPEANTNFGSNTSPEFNWSGAPQGTQSYAIVLQDIANGFVHWAIWNIPGSATSLASGLPSTPTLTEPNGAQQATFFSMMGYFGPGACNVYEFTLYALDTASFTPSDTGDPEVVKPELDAAGALATLTIRGAADMSYCSGGGTCTF